MKVTIDWDELYPAYFVSDNPKCGTEVDATPEQAKKWKRVLDQYDAVQAEMRAAVEGK